VDGKCNSAVILDSTDSQDRRETVTREIWEEEDFLGKKRGPRKGRHAKRGRRTYQIKRKMNKSAEGEEGKQIDPRTDRESKKKK